MSPTGRARRVMRWVFRAAASLVLVLLVAIFVFGPRLIEQRFNTLGSGEAREPSEHAARLHASAFVADLHADTLLWDRDLLERGTRGHVDVPRLREGGVALQVFSVPTRTPQRFRIRGRSFHVDGAKPLSFVSLDPPWTWTRPRSRALHHARRMQRFVRRSDGELVLIRTRGDLEALVAARARGEAVIGAMLATEGSPGVGQDLEGLDDLFDAGYRMFGLAHFRDTDVAGSTHDSDAGLTPLGLRALGRIEDLGMILDVSHASPRAIDDVLRVARRPVVASHGGAQAVCGGARNLSDAHLAAIGRRGGLIGIGYFRGATCGRSDNVRAIVRSIRHAAAVAGIEHVALGSDFDGAVRVPFDASELAVLTDALLRSGMSEQDVRAVLGGNVLRFLRDMLPAEEQAASGPGKT